MSVPDLDDPAALNVFADELEEQGDPRAALIRAQLEGDTATADALVSRHREAWLGPLDPEHMLVTWKNGFVTEVASDVRVPPQFVHELVRRPTFARLRRLALSSIPDLSVLGSLPALQALVLFTRAEESLESLAGVCLPSLERLMLDVRGPTSFEALSTLEAPRLRFLDTQNGSAEFIEAVGRANWAGRLERWFQRFPGGDFAALRTCPALMKTRGRQLVLQIVGWAHGEEYRAFRGALPEAKVVRRYEVIHGDRDHSRRVERPTVAPPPGARQVGRLITPPLDDRPEDFRRCRWCDSDDTRCIRYHRFSVWQLVELTHHEAWDGVCAACGLFTQWSIMTFDS